jgi:hypothetical protein
MKKLGVFVMAVALMAPVIAAAPAGAAAVVTCAKPSGFVAFKPGLKATTKAIQTTTFNLPVTGCTGTGGVKSGTSKGSSKGTKPENCATFGAAGKTVTNVVITWNTKATSTAKLTTTVAITKTGINATVTGKISKGLFLGKTVKTKVAVTIPKGTCTDAKPLTKATLKGLAPLTIS